MAATIDPAEAGSATAETAASVDAHGNGPRSLMVRKLTDIVVLPAARLSSNERALTADILMQVVDKVEVDLRIDIARRLSRVAEAPPALLRMLVLDEPQVAAPILRSADFLPQALLIDAARYGQKAHREMIARRIDLTPAVADALIAADEPEVARLLLKREEFTLSSGAMDALVARSAVDGELAALLLRRRELEPAHGFMMFWWVDSERRRRILQRFSLDRTILQEALHELYPTIFQAEKPDPIVKEILVMLDRRHRPRGVNGEPVAMDVVKKTLAAARNFPAPEVVHAVSMIAGVSRDLASRILRDPGGEPYAVMCKSLGVPRDEYFSFISGDDPEIEGAITPQRAEELLGVFDSMARDFSRAVMRYWDWDGNPRIARILRLMGLEEQPGFGEEKSVHNPI